MDTTIIRAFIGKNADYYLESFEKVSRKKTAWHWSAFFLGVGWLCYRRMYRYAFIFGALITLETVIEAFLNIPPGISNGLSVGIWVIFGMLGNKLYMAHAEKQIHLVQSQSLSEAELLETLALKGKPSALMGIFGILILVSVLFGLLYGLIISGVAGT